MKKNHFTNLINNNNEILPSKLFTHLFGKMPNTLHIRNVKGKEFLDFLADEQKLEPIFQYREKYVDGKRTITRNMERTLAFPTEEILFGDKESLTYLFIEEQLFSEKKLLEKAKNFLIAQEKRKPRIQLITPSNSGISLQYFDCDTQPTDLHLNYNDDLEVFHKEFVKKLNSPKMRGIHFLYGKPGTGKTHYLRHIIGKIKKDVIYIPSGMAEVLADPGLLQLLIDARGDVLIIEDAEKAIISRESSYNNAVSTLLNISDGLLSDVLNMQIICTFNTDLRNVDKALLRPGRLLSKYEFRSLEPAKARKLSQTLDRSQSFEQPVTLAEIYAGQEAEEVSLNTQRGVGF